MPTEPDRHRRFATTRWSLVTAASAGGDQARAALAELCELYWYPLYAFVRRQGVDADAASDLTQGFFARFIELESVRSARQDRGRFRSYLLGAVKHFLANERQHAKAQKRGGDKTILSFDPHDAETRYQREPAHDLTPEHIFERRWALLLIERTLDQLGNEMTARGKSKEFERLRPFLVADASGDSYRDAATELGLSEGAVKVLIHRLRRRFRDHLRGAIAETVASPADIDDEIRHLFTCLAR
ncbi:MAG: sigma-70 family RNA polymerase sigma factor [Tepidisphaeraceae bacterium]